MPKTRKSLSAHRPIARLEPVAGSHDAGPDAGRLARLERAGVIRRGRGGRLEEILRVPPPRAEKGVDILAVLLEERRPALRSSTT